MSDTNHIGTAYIISPLDEEKEPIELYFVVTEGGLLLHMEKMDKEISKEVVAAELAKLLTGLEKSDGRYNEFIKNPANYKIRMAIVPPLSIEDARIIDSMYRLPKEERQRRISNDLERWAR